MSLIQRLRLHAGEQPDALALSHPGGSLSYAELVRALDEACERLRALEIDCLALDLDNGSSWAVLDLAAMDCGITLIPLPPFFSSHQMHHALSQSGTTMIISDQPQRLQQRLAPLELTSQQPLTVCGQRLESMATGLPAKDLPQGIAKITFTSGTTGEPKGVMLSLAQMEQVTQSLASAVNVQTHDRHLALTPLAVLLENVAGLYVPLWAGASVAIPSLSETGLLGAAGLDARRMLQALNEHDATSAIFSPQMLQGVVSVLESGPPKPDKLRFIALGGAAVSRRLLDRAVQQGLPVFEGYGLSEFASVVCLNRPGENRPGSVGKPLEHVTLSLAEDGEVLISGNLFAGYLGETQPAQCDEWWHSGDIGHLDEDGYLYLQGRRRHIFITAYGRNVSPEWVERELTLEPAIAQAAVFGEARPWNIGVIVPGRGADSRAVQSAIERVNRLLPDYARVTQWFPGDEPFQLENGQLSGTGRLRRESIFQHYRTRIEAHYAEELVV